MTQQINGTNKNPVEKSEDNFIETQQNDIFGRFSIAKEFIPAGTVLFEETPFVIGPKPNTTPLCLECCCSVDGTVNGSRCSNCKWPLCEECQKNLNLKYHCLECEVFTKNKVRFQNLPSADQLCLQLDCITPLR